MTGLKWSNVLFKNRLLKTVKEPRACSIFQVPAHNWSADINSTVLIKTLLKYFHYGFWFSFLIGCTTLR